MTIIFPILKTVRLLLNRPTENDLEDIVFHLNQTSEIAENTLTMPFPYTAESAKIWFTMIEDGFQKKNAYIFAIRESQIGKLIGAIGLHIDLGNNKAEVGYWIGENFRNKGYVTEALQEVLKFGFETINLNKIFASHFPHNPASGKVLLKNNFIEEGILKQEILKNGKFLDLIRYSILKENWHKKNY